MAFKGAIKRVFPERLKRTLLGALANWRRGELEWVLGPLQYNRDGLATRHSCDFMRDEAFMSAYARGKATGSWKADDIHYRAYVACWAASRGIQLEGDFVECGVNKGGSALTVIAYVGLERHPKTFYLLDTFCGLDEDHILEEEKQRGIHGGRYEECHEAVKLTFSEFKNVRIIKGTVPETLPEVKTKKVAYLHIDMNCAAPEIAAAEFFWDKLVPGAAMVIDDYGWTGHEVQKREFDRFAYRKGQPILALPTGQGLLIKL